MQITDLFEKIEPTIGEGNKYLWQCFGHNAWGIDIKEHVHVVYDVKTQLVYQITFYDYNEDFSFEDAAPAYVWTDTKYKQKYLNECKRRNIVDNTFIEIYISMKDIIKRVKKYQNV